MKRRVGRFTVARRATAATFTAVLVLSGLGRFPWFQGSLSGARWFDAVPLVDPLAAIETTLASRALHGEMLLGAGLLVVVAILLGPVFCGWVCPLGLLLDLNQALRRKLLRSTAAAPPRFRLPREVRWLLLGLFVGVAAIFRIPVFQTISPINVVGWSLVFGALPALSIVAVLAAVEWFAPRVWCRSLCPLGALYGLLGAWAPFRVRIHPSENERRPCHLCSASCPMGIDVVGDFTLVGKSSVDDPDCTRCGACTEVCPAHTLALRFRDFD